MKTGFLITARLKSKRLPMKILKDLNGRTVIERIIDRAKAVKGVSDIVLCTSTNPQDRPLLDVALNNGIYYFTGSEDDVLDRFLSTSKLFGLDYILNITSDNPLFSIYHTGLLMNGIRKNRYDYLTIEGLPLGTACWGIRVKALEFVCKLKKIRDTEIWGHLFNQPKLFDVLTIKAEGIFQRPDVRLTLDYKEDYKMLNGLFKNITFDKVLDLKDVLKYLAHNSAKLKINSHCYQRSLDSNVRKEIDKFYMDHLKEFLKIKKDVYRDTNLKEEDL